MIRVRRSVRRPRRRARFADRRLERRALRSLRRANRRRPTRRAGRSMLRPYPALSWEAAVVGLVLALVCLVYYSLRWYGFDLLEEGYFLTNARAVQLGHLPYRDFDTPYTPGVFYLYARLMDWFGTDLTVLRTWQIGGRVAFFLALYLCGRQVVPPYFAALSPAMIAMMDTAPELWGIHPGWITTPASALAVLAIARYVRTGHLRWLLACGLANGVSFAFKQNLALYGLMAALWFLAVAERFLPTVRLPRPVASRVAGWLPEWLAWLVIRSTQFVALLLLPTVALAIVRPFLSPQTLLLFVFPMLALSVFAATRVVGGPRAAAGDLQEAAVAFLFRPLVVLLGFVAVTLPWLWALMRALDWRLELLGPLAGQIDLTGYFFGMAPPTVWHVLLVASTLLAPFAIGTVVMWRLWSRRGAALLLAVLAVLVVRRVALGVAGDGEPWNPVRALHAPYAAAAAAWASFGDHPPPTNDLVLYMPSLAFWAGLAWLASSSCPCPARAPEVQSSKWTTKGAVVHLWFLVAGASLFLDQFPRTDEIHWLWSAGLLLVCGAAVLSAWERRAVRLVPQLARAAGARAAFRLGALALPLVALFPHVWLRLDAWSQLMPPAPGDAHAATQYARARLVPLAMPDGGSRVWVPAADADVIQEVVGLLQERTGPGEPIFAYPVIPGFYFLADRPNPTRFNHLFRGMASPADQQQMVAALEGVRYVVWDDGGARYWVQPGDNAPVTEYVRTHFTIERFVGPYAVLARGAGGIELPYYLPGQAPQ